MPPVTPGPGFQRYEFRKGAGEFPGWGGMMRDADPGSLPTHRPRLVVNGLFRNGGIESRPGQMLLNATALGDLDAFGDGKPIMTLADFQIIQAIKLWIVVDGCPGTGSGAGFGILHYDQEQEPPLQRAVWYDGLNLCASLATYSGGIYAGLDNEFVRLSRVGVPFGVEGLDLTASGLHTPLKSFTDFQKIPCLYAFNGRLFIGLEHSTPTGSKVMAYDGTSILDDLTGIPQPTGMGTWREYLFVGFASSTIRRRNEGAPPGTWTTIAAPGAWVGTGFAYKDKLYYTDGTSVFSYDGAFATHTVAGATRMTLIPAHGYLFYAYTSGGARSIVGRYDGTTWEDTHKDLTTQFPGLIGCRACGFYKNDVYTINTQPATPPLVGDDFLLARSNKADTGGDWEGVNIGWGNSINDPNQTLVF